MIFRSTGAAGNEVGAGQRLLKAGDRFEAPSGSMAKPWSKGRSHLYLMNFEDFIGLEKSSFAIGLCLPFSMKIMQS
jgi:hypothetical protein